MLRFFDGFDSYVTADLGLRYNIPGGGSMQIVPSIGRFGSGALRNQISGGGETLAKFFDDQATWIVGVAYAFAPSGKATTIIAFQDSGQGQVELYMNTSNILQVRRNGTVIGTGTHVLSANTFYFLEFKATISSSIAAHSCVARIGGVVEIDVAAGSSTDAQGTGKANRVCLFYDQFQTQSTHDDLYVCDGTGSTSNDFLGDSRVEDLSATGQGHYSDFSRNTGSTNYGAINETSANGDTSYVYSSTVGDKETYTFPSLASTPTAVYGVQLVAISRKDDAGGRALTPLIRHASCTRRIPPAE